MQRPTIVCLCGSTRFTKEFAQANLEETMDGNIVLSVGAYVHDDALDLTRLQKAQLDVLHFQKILLADEVLVINVDGYVGESTEREIEFAFSLGKFVRWWDKAKVPEAWRDPEEEVMRAALEDALLSRRQVAAQLGVDIPHYDD